VRSAPTEGLVVMAVTKGSSTAGALPREKSRWRCSTCGRTFARRGQTHSCTRVPIEAHIPHEGAVRTLFDALLDAVEVEVGPFEVVSLPCCIHLAGTDDFLAILPKRDRIEIRFTLHHRLHSPRILACTEISRESHKHRIDVTGVEEIDAELLSWLREAYLGTSSAPTSSASSTARR
jgi:hypothetical protein